MSEPVNDDQDKRVEGQPPVSLPQPGLNPYDTSAPDVYANVSRIIVGAADVSILFGFEIDPVANLPLKPLVRIVLSHDNFIRMMQSWNTRVDFLKDAYKGTPKSLNDLFDSDPEALTKVLGDLLKGEYK